MSLTDTIRFVLEQHIQRGLIKYALRDTPANRITVLKELRAISLNSDGNEDEIIAVMDEELSKLELQS